MNRLFYEGSAIKKTALDGLWRYRKDPENVGVSRQWYGERFDSRHKLNVPLCWSCSPELFGYEGVLWYQTEFCNTYENVALCFEGVLNECSVYIDGKFIGRHYGGFVEFRFRADELEPGCHVLTVRVDNTHDDISTIPLAVVDWFHHGGIFRSVILEEKEHISIENLHVSYQLEDSVAAVHFHLDLYNYESAEIQDRLKIYLDDRCVFESEYSIQDSLHIDIRPIAVENIEAWEVDAPRLYNVRAEFAGKDARERVGFRKIEVRNKKFYLNGRELTLKGINRHEEHPDWGFSVPFALNKRDIDIIRGMGCNAIRGSHYPVSKSTLDYMDEIGMLFWEEVPVWGFPETALENPMVMERGLQLHREMILRDLNHPCIIIWGLHNEIDTCCDAGVKITEAFAGCVRSLDSSRLITYATDRPLADRCFAFADFISVNKYIGWYGGVMENWTDFLSQLEEKMDKDAEGKPLVMSEFGAAAIYGNHTFDNIKWTEEYQANLIGYELELFKSNPNICGTFIWQFCDIRSAEEKANDRARSFNNKGILNEHRKPKLAYDAVKRRYAAL